MIGDDIIKDGGFEAWDTSTTLTHWSGTAESGGHLSQFQPMITVQEMATGDALGKEKLNIDILDLAEEQTDEDGNVKRVLVDDFGKYTACIANTAG